jgi:hypothetical protein
MRMSSNRVMAGTSPAMTRSWALVAYFVGAGFRFLK